jgi:pyridinium-3,5-bisthiocarboxylic acid mononucleotide nickel chelatase
VTRAAYVDCVGGLAGDMLLAALVDAGADDAKLRSVPQSLGLARVEIVVRHVERHGIGALQVVVRAEDPAPERSWPSIRELLATAALDEEVRARSIAVFTRLADAESSIHRVRPDEVHFHELGGVDTLVDVCGAVTLLHDLGVSRLCCSPLPAAWGLVEAAHGKLPLPAPATLELLKGAPIVGVEGDGELVTPTGAALVATLADAFGPPPPMTLEQVGYGAGARDTRERPNLVRILVGEVANGPTAEVSLLETNLDDIVPELIPDAIERCFAAGALDVWTVPANMKKGRPGIVLSALTRPENERAVAEAVLEETSALGVRVARLRRYELEREERSVLVDGEVVRLKLGRLDGRLVNIAPEHDDCAAVARRLGRPVKSVWAAALAAAQHV